MKVLIVDDNRDIVDSLSFGLKKEGFNVFCLYDGYSAVEYVNNNHCDLIIMDIDMPKLDGISALKDIKKKTNIPVFIISERINEFDILFAYESGCTDYIRKPLIIKEIIFKIKNYFNKTNLKIHKYGGLEIDSLGRNIFVDGQKKILTLKEFQLLNYLVNNKGIAVSREKLLNDVWGYGFFGDDRTIDTHIKKLRNMLGEYKDYIQTVRGFGYKFDDLNA